MKKIAFASFAVIALALPVMALAPQSGLNVGEKVSAYHPQHVSGPDAGTDTCPPCKYGNRPAVQVWLNGESEENIMAMAKALDSKVAGSKKEFKAFMINLTHCDACVDGTKAVAKKSGLKNVAMAYLPKTDEAVKAYKVNTSADVKNTVFVYKNREVVAKFVNLKADAEGLKALSAAVAKIDN